MASHIIHKQKLVLRVSRDKDSFSLQNRASALLRDEIPARIDSLFNEFSSTDEIIRIDSMRLDLGIVTAENFETEFAAQLIAELREALSQQLESIAFSKHSTQNKSEIVVIRPAQSLTDALLYFLEHGQFPWFRTGSTIHELEEEIINTFSTTQWTSLLQRLQKGKESISLRRLVYQFSDAFVEALIIAGQPNESIEWRSLSSDLQLLLKQFYSVGKEETRYLVWEFLLQQALDDGQLASPEERIAEWLLTFAIQSELSEKVIVSETIASFLTTTTTATTTTTTTTTTTLTTTVKVALKKLQLLLVAAEKEKQLDRLSEKKLSESKNVFDLTESNSGHGSDFPDTQENARKRGKAERIPNVEQECYVNNSGVILLHPFLENYFDALGLLNERQFVNSSAQQRCVLLLHYLATGSIIAPENDLVLQKVLTDSPLVETLPMEIELTEQELTESENLLQSVISYWPPLKNTSVEGLRATFLQREGKLTPVEGGWRLTIEQKTVDILLGKLPWGFSTIRLPWMENTVHVDWC